MIGLISPSVLCQESRQWQHPHRGQGLETPTCSARSTRVGGVRPVRRLVLQGVHVLCHFHIFSHYLKILAKPKNRLYFAQPILFICVLLSCLSSPFSVGKSLAFDSLIRGALFILPLFSFYVPWSSKPKLK